MDRTNTLVVVASIVVGSCGADRRSGVRDPGVDAVAQGGSGGMGDSMDAGIGGHSSNDAGADVKIIVDTRDAPGTGKDVAVDTRVVDMRLADRGPPTDAMPPSGGLVLHWPFDEGSGMVVKDSSGSNFTGLLKGRNAGPVPEFVPGKKDSALELNRVIDPNGSYQVQYVELPYPDTNGLLDIGADEDVTVSAWINREGDFYGDSMCIVSKQGDRVTLPESSLVGPGYSIHLLNEAYDSTLFAWISDGVHGFFTGVTKTAQTRILPMTGWHHVAFVFDHHALENCRWYLDGNEVAVTRSEWYIANDELRMRPAVLPAGSLANTLPLTVGKRASGNEAPFNGAIDEVRIYNRALTSDEVQALYTNP